MSTKTKPWRRAVLDQIHEWVDERHQGPWSSASGVAMRRLDKLDSFIRVFFPEAHRTGSPIAVDDAAALIVMPRAAALKLSRRMFRGGGGIAADLQAEDLTWNMDWFTPPGF